MISRGGHCGIFFYSESLIALTIDPGPLELALKSEASNLQVLGRLMVINSEVHDNSTQYASVMSSYTSGSAFVIFVDNSATRIESSPRVHIMPYFSKSSLQPLPSNRRPL